jgi:hypothetical protein
MRLHTYLLTVALCAGTAGVAFAQVPGNRAATTQSTGLSQATTGQQTLPPQPTSAGTVGVSAATGSSAPVAPAGAIPVLSAENTGSNPNLQAMVREHAVITSDDLVAMKFNTAEVFIPTEFTDQPVVDPALCDAGCEAEARAAAGMNHVQDGAWEAQFQAARMDLAADRDWGQAYADGMQRLHSYCVFQQQAKKAFPRGNDTASQDQRAQWAQYVGAMNQSLGGGVDSSAARIQESIQQAQRRDSVRAAIMEVLAERAFSQCTSAR